MRCCSQAFRSCANLAAEPDPDAPFDIEISQPTALCRHQSNLLPTFVKNLLRVVQATKPLTWILRPDLISPVRIAAHCPFHALPAAHIHLRLYASPLFLLPTPACGLGNAHLKTTRFGCMPAFQRPQSVDFGSDRYAFKTTCSDSCIRLSTL